ncbi:MAG TPA: ABC transporter ATP-binding protein [Propionibacteriaceae bacterium]|nr:ABC transporter ATP-binding protein [Propionibacteriaceae bacterium]
MTEPIIEAVDVVKQFPIRGRLGTSKALLTAVDHVNLSIHPGETVALVGESGSGKSTLGRVLLDLEKPTSGEVRFRGQGLESLTGPARQDYRRNVQVVFQDTGSSLNPRHDIATSVGLGLRYNLGLGQKVADAKSHELLRLVGLDPDSFASRSPLELSGGQRQRVAIARAMASDPDFIVADEAVSALDVSVRAQVLMVMKRLQVTRDLAYLFITHDLGVVRTVSERVVVLYLGQVVNSGPTDDVFGRPSHPYTKALLEAATVPDPAVRGRERIRLSGDIPSPINPPSGCRFHTRCPLARERCRTEAPELRAIRPGVETRCHFPEEVTAMTAEVAGS